MKDFYLYETNDIIFITKHRCNFDTNTLPFYLTEEVPGFVFKKINSRYCINCSLSLKLRKSFKCDSFIEKLIPGYIYYMIVKNYNRYVFKLDCFIKNMKKIKSFKETDSSNEGHLAEYITSDNELFCDFKEDSYGFLMFIKINLSTGAVFEQGIPKSLYFSFAEQSRFIKRLFINYIINYYNNFAKTTFCLIEKYL